MIPLKEKYGFTLVEIMIVITIIALLAGIAIPNLLRARLNANEIVAIKALRTISTACTSFYSQQTPPTYPADLSALSAANPPYIHQELSAAVDQATATSGYFFTYRFVDANQFTCTATPSLPDITGVRIFFVDETGLTRLNDAAGPAIE